MFKTIKMASAAFAALLPESLTDEQLVRLVKWAKETCEKSDVVMTEEGRMQLLAIRKEAKTARDFQRLLRTNLAHWSVDMPVKQTGWLKLISEGEYETLRCAMASRASAPADRPETETGAESPAVLKTSCHEGSKQHETHLCLRMPANLLSVRA